MIVFAGGSTDGGALLVWTAVRPWKGGQLFKAIVTTDRMAIADERQLSIHLSKS